MRPDETRRQYGERLWRQSREAFVNHELKSSGEGRWTIMQRHKDGGWDWHMAAEIVCMWNRAIVVNGDIDAVVFAYGPKEPEARVRWMGKHTDMSYVQEKAQIGTTSRDLVETYEPDVARTDLIWHIRERLEELKAYEGSDTVDQAIAKLIKPDSGITIYNSGDKCLDAFAEAYRWQTEDGHHALFNFLYNFDGAEFESETIAGIGMVIAPRVFYAQAALARLCELLEQKEEQDGDGEGDGRHATGGDAAQGAAG